MLTSFDAWNHRHRSSTCPATGRRVTPPLRSSPPGYRPGLRIHASVRLCAALPESRTGGASPHRDLLGGGRAGAVVRDVRRQRSRLRHRPTPSSSAPSRGLVGRRKAAQRIGQREGEFLGHAGHGPGTLVLQLASRSGTRRRPTRSGPPAPVRLKPMFEPSPQPEPSELDCTFDAESTTPVPEIRMALQSVGLSASMPNGYGDLILVGGNRAHADRPHRPPHDAAEDRPAARVDPDLDRAGRSRV